MAAEEAREGVKTDLTAYGKPLTEGFSFKFLGRILPASENDWPMVIYKLRKAQNMWTRLLRVLRQEIADTRMSRKIHMAVIQEVLLFGL